MTNPLEVLNQFWGYTDFRPLQLEIIQTALTKKNQFVMLPTGGGKSICYQIPALILPNTTLVISPLIALMDDQVNNLHKVGIKAAALHSGISLYDQVISIEQAISGNIKILYVSPEKLATDSFKDTVVDLKLSLLVVDEAHCISQWGHDFRPTYRQINQFKKWAKPDCTMALSATATKKVQQDIINQLDIDDCIVFKKSVVRKNLHYHVMYSDNKINKAIDLLNQKKSTAILYCNTRRSSEESAILLNAKGIEAIPYHAGLTIEQRSSSQYLWMKSNTKTICATSAFGMGIDKPNVRQVIHLSPPFSLEEYYQEAGRAGRDGNVSDIILLYNQKDISRLDIESENKFPPINKVRQLYNSICNYIKLELGQGYNQKYIFDLIDFAHAYKVPVNLVLNCIKTIERAGYWVFQNDDASQHTVLFTSDRIDWEQIKVLHQDLYSVIIHLLRLHGNILHYPTQISITLDAKNMQLSYEQLKNSLVSLHQYGLINYQPAMQGASILMLHERIPAKQLMFDLSKITAMKLVFQERIKLFKKFIQSKDTCRQVLLADYFGESQIVSCGHCDFCMSKATIDQSGEYIKHIIATFKSQKSIPVKELNLVFNTSEMKVLMAQLQKLVEEGILEHKGANIIFVE